ncbi:hypothetical protein VNI00_013615 [Paramarasmius palmivorus]|uniref:Uncharacterized protein n=1 Tax=Paramarasmius palmivorus TaxID=297713 RepID=A0AAW0BY66_9AGAR
MPSCGEVPEENIRVALGPAYCGQPPSKCRDVYQSMGVGLFDTLSSVTVDQSRRATCILRELPVIAHRTVTGEVPTHVFVVYERARSNVHGPRKVLLLPFHAIVVASHCARLPPLAPSPIINDSQTTAVPVNQPIQLTLPVEVIGVPNLQTFRKVLQYVYLRHVEFLYATFLPTPFTQFHDAFNEVGTNQPSPKRNDPDELAKSFFTHPLNSARQHEFAKELSQNYSAYQMLKKLRLIQRIWKNVVALGILDPVLWAVMRGCYEVLVRAFASCFQIRMEMVLNGLED